MAAPIGQTFKVDAGNSPGYFVTKIDLFFAAKHPTLGVTVELREVNSAGQITNKVLPGSQVRLESASINVSSTAETATTFTFEYPVFLLNSTQYAFVVKSDGNNDLTTLWVAKLGDNDIVSGKKITTQPYIGELFVSSNDLNYDSTPDEDIKFILYRANFSTGTGTVNFVNQPIEYVKAGVISGNFAIKGEDVHGETRMTFTGITGGSISNTDILVGSTSGATGTVVLNNSGTYRIKNVSTDVKFTSGETVNVLYANSAAKSVYATLSTQTVPIMDLLDYTVVDANNVFVSLSKQNTISLNINEELRGQISNNYITVGELMTKKINLINPQTTQISLMGTEINWTSASTSNTGTLSGFSSTSINKDFVYSTERIIDSYTNIPETYKMSATMRTVDPKISPVLNAHKTHAIFVHNLINNDSTNEDQNRGGNALVKYITQKVTLAEGQDAEDLKAYITGYRPPLTDIKLYYKILNGGDSDTFDDINWKEMVLSSKDLYSDVENVEDYKEFEFSIPASQLTGSNEEVQYTNGDGVVFTGFKYFSLKIVLLSENSVRIPKCKDLRSICLQK